MCGICGMIGVNDEITIRRMCGALAHRGPDSECVIPFNSPPATIGHRRLAIIDLSSAASQPMPNEDGSLHLTYNGEIYNFAELRSELQALGHRFRSNSDSEVVIHAYEQWGVYSLQKFRGMFAFALYDSKRGILFFARDRIGEKPFYYALKDSAFAFASEIAALRQWKSISNRLNLIAMIDYLHYGYTIPPNTFFKDISELPPAHYGIYQNGTLTIRRYWSLPAEPIQERGEVYEYINTLIEESIRMRLIADVEVGLFLSGGIDSSSIAAAAGRNLKAITVTFPGFSANDETRFAKEVANHLGFTSIITSAHPFAKEDLLLEVLSHFGQPFGNPTALLTYRLSETTRQFVKVALAGDGGDEIFFGYPRHRGYAFLCNLDFIPSLPRKVIGNLLSALIPFESEQGLHFLRRYHEFTSSLGERPEKAYARWNSYFNRNELNLLLCGEAAHLLTQHNPENFILSLFNLFRKLDPLSRAAAVDIVSFLPFNILQYADRMSSAHNLEVRVPFCDHMLIEFCAALPAKLRYNPRRQKYVLWRVFNARLPKNVFRRRKVGFNPPTAYLINHELRTLFDSLILQPDETGLLNVGYLRKLLAEHRSGRRDNSLKLWAVLMLRLFLKNLS
ncbi:MAG: asparagine synthase (glutamine-hydrolyzing) [Planctomycetota bacterium]|nr:asparagine synthase (glutamine-hydrolyzing) [Planctomycetota bacterium]